MLKKTAKSVYEKFVDLGEYNISWNNHITQNVRPSTYFLLAYVAFRRKCLEGLDLDDLQLLVQWHHKEAATSDSIFLTLRQWQLY